MNQNKRSSDEFYKNEVEARRKAIENLITDIKDAIVSGIFKERSLIERISLHNSVVKKSGDFNKDFQNTENATKNQIYAAMTAKKNCHRYSELISSVMEEVSSTEDLNDYIEFVEMKIPDKIKYYLIQAKKCYYFGSYDACIVMIARAIEFSIKEYLKKEGYQVPKPAVMGPLISAYETHLVKKDVLKYIAEVQKMDRNISAHDSDSERQTMGKPEADHSWTAIKIILRDLLRIDIKVRVETE